jgi:phosphoglycolate phosphatase
MIGLSLSDTIRRLSPALAPEHAARIATAYRSNYRTRIGSPTLFPAVRDTLVGLQQSGYHLAVATGKSQAGLRQVIEETGLVDIFVATCTADQSEPKPSPAMLYAILSDLDIEPDRALMIGDTEFDLAMARAAGTQLAGVSYGAHPVTRLLPYEPAFVLDHFGELPGKLSNLSCSIPPPPNRPSNDR